MVRSRVGRGEKPDKDEKPDYQVYYFTCRLQEEREVAVYCDLHGHSRKQNVFIYGCENKTNPDWRLRERVFPVMLSRNACDKVGLRKKRLNKFPNYFEKSLYLLEKNKLFRKIILLKIKFHIILRY